MVHQRASHQKTFAQRFIGLQSPTLNCKREKVYADERGLGWQNTIRLREPARSWIAKDNKATHRSTTLCTPKYYNLLLRTTNYWQVFLRITKHYKVLDSSGKYYKVLESVAKHTHYYSAIQSTTKYDSILQSTRYSITPCYKVLFRTTTYQKVLQSITPYYDEQHLKRCSAMRGASKGLLGNVKSLRFTTVADSDVRRARNDEKIASRALPK